MKTAENSPVPRPSYLKFFWPLSLMGVVMISGRLIQNFVLLRYENGVNELAWFALAMALYAPFQSVIAMVPHMTTVWGATPGSRKKAFRFFGMVCMLISLPLFGVAFSPAGPALVNLVYGTDSHAERVIIIYMRYLAPLVLLGGWRQYLTGLLVLAEKTGWVTSIRCLAILSAILVLAAGILTGWNPVHVIGLSSVIPAMVAIAVSLWVVSSDGALAGTDNLRPNSGRNYDHAGFKDMFGYFLPVAFTTFMFTLSRPIIFAFIRSLNPENRPGGVNANLLIASLTLAFTIGFVFQGTVNQFRHLMVKFGRKDPMGVRRFMVRVCLVITGVFFLFRVTPLSRLFLIYLQQCSDPQLLQNAQDCLWVLMLSPLVVTFRNYYHGLALVHHRTRAMGVGGLARNGIIILSGIIFLQMDILTHTTGAFMMVLAFLAEGIAVMLLTRSWRKPMGV